MFVPQESHVQAGLASQIPKLDSETSRPAQSRLGKETHYTRRSSPDVTCEDCRSTWAMLHVTLYYVITYCEDLPQKSFLASAPLLEPSHASARSQNYLIKNKWRRWWWCHWRCIYCLKKLFLSVTVDDFDFGRHKVHPHREQMVAIKIILIFHCIGVDDFLLWQIIC